MKIYNANNKGFINYLIVGFVLFLIGVFFLDNATLMAKPFIFLPLLSPLPLILWTYFSTIYKIENDKLIYRSGFLKGEIEISRIKEILKGKTQWVGVKPALAKDGLIIKFNTYDTVYIAPESNTEMIRDLLNINPQIKITE